MSRKWLSSNCFKGIKAPIPHSSIFPFSHKDPPQIALFSRICGVFLHTVTFICFHHKTPAFSLAFPPDNSCQKKIRYQACLITDFKGFCLNHVIIRPGYFSLTTKTRRSNKDTSIPVVLIMTIMFCDKWIMIMCLNSKECLHFT